MAQDPHDNAPSIHARSMLFDPVANVWVPEVGNSAGAASIVLGANDGVDIGDVTVNNASGTASVNIQDGGNSITIDGSVTANAGTNLNTSLLALESGGNLAAAAASLSVIDDWDETDRAKVNIIAGQVGVQGGSGVVNALTQRVVLATDVALPSGANTIGLLGANSGVDIGDVTINNTSGVNSINIQDGGNSITVDGSVTANAGTNLNTSLLALESGGNLAAAAASLSVIDDWDETDRAKVNIIAGQVGVQGGTGTTNALTQRVVLATDVALPSGANIIGALVANQSVNVAQMNGATVTMGSGVVGTGVQRVVLATDVALPSGTNSIGVLGANSGIDIGDVTINNASGAASINIQDGGNSITVDGTVTATPTGTYTTKETRSTAAAHTSVVAATASTSLLASNANRLGATIYNDSSNTLYLKLAATASVTSYTLKLSQDDYYEVPYAYTGVINGIWTATTGSSLLVEFT